MKGLALIASLLASGLLKGGMPAEEIAKRSLRVPFLDGLRGGPRTRSRKLRGRKPQRRFGAPLPQLANDSGKPWLTYAQHDHLVRLKGARWATRMERFRYSFDQMLAMANGQA